MLCGGWGAGLTENKAKPSSWGLAELGNKLSRVGGGGCAGYVVGVAGLTENKAKPSSWGLAELGNTVKLVQHRLFSSR